MYKSYPRLDGDPDRGVLAVHSLGRVSSNVRRRKHPVLWV